MQVNSEQASFIPQRCWMGRSSKVFGEDSVLLGEPVDTIVRLSHPPDGSTDGVCLVSHGHTSGGLVNLGDVDLDAGVVLGGQDTVTGGALPETFHI